MSSICDSIQIMLKLVYAVSKSGSNIFCYKASHSLVSFLQLYLTKLLEKAMNPT